MTRVVILEKTGGPEVLQVKTIKLEKLGPEEVLIQHKAIGLNYIDTYHRSGLYPLQLPSGIGAEGSGIIKEIGSQVKDFTIGDRVCYAGAPLGSYSAERNYPTKNLVKLPKEIDFEIAATLMTKGLTTFYLLHKTYPVTSNETVLFHAAAGGVGQIFCQWAKSLGCKVIGTVGTDDKINIAKKNGCDFVINYSKDDFAKKVLEITKGKGVPVVFDGVGKRTFKGSLACLKTRGMMISFGNASGPLEPVNVPKEIQPKGLYLTRPSIAQYFTNRKDLQIGADEVFEKVKFGKIKIRISKKYKLEEAKKAHEDLEARRLMGPAILIP